jgi:hypothetical protein
MTFLLALVIVVGARVAAYLLGQKYPDKRQAIAAWLMGIGGILVILAGCIGLRIIFRTWSREGGFLGTLAIGGMALLVSGAYMIRSLARDATNERIYRDRR